MILNNSASKQKTNHTFAFVILVCVITAIIMTVTIWFLQKQTVTAPQAAAATTIGFTPIVQVVMPGNDISSALTINPGSNQISFVHVAISYKSSELEVLSSTSLIVNQTAFTQTIEPPQINCNGNQCLLTATYGTGSNPKNAIVKATPIATFHATVTAPMQTRITVGFDPTTSASPLGSSGPTETNIISSTNPLSFIVGGALCQMNQSTCSWDPVPDAASYQYQVIEKNSNTTVIQGNVPSTQTAIIFSSHAGLSYTCNVTAVNVCGQGNPGSGTSVCTAPTIPPLAVQPTQKQLASLSSLLTDTPTPPDISVTPTEVATMASMLTGTPMPTVIAAVQAAATKAPSPTLSPTPTSCDGPGTVSNLHISCPDCNN